MVNLNKSMTCTDLSLQLSTVLGNSCTPVLSLFPRPLSFLQLSSQFRQVTLCTLASLNSCSLGKLCIFKLDKKIIPYRLHKAKMK